MIVDDWLWRRSLFPSFKWWLGGAVLTAGAIGYLIGR